MRREPSSSGEPITAADVVRLVSIVRLVDGERGVPSFGLVSVGERGR